MFKQWVLIAALSNWTWGEDKCIAISQRDKCTKIKNAEFHLNPTWRASLCKAFFQRGKCLQEGPQCIAMWNEYRNDITLSGTGEYFPGWKFTSTFWNASVCSQLWTSPKWECWDETKMDQVAQDAAENKILVPGGTSGPVWTSVDQWSSVEQVAAAGGREFWAAHDSDHVWSQRLCWGKPVEDWIESKSQCYSKVRAITLLRWHCQWLARMLNCLNRVRQELL